MTSRDNQRDRAQAANTETRFTIPPGIPTKVSIEVEPGSICRVAAASDPLNRLTVVADPDGEAAFYAEAPWKSVELQQLDVEVETASGSQHRGITLRVDLEPSRKFPSPDADRRRRVYSSGNVRPPLSDKEMAHLSEEELLTRGYPVRPHHEDAPRAFEAWRRVVSTPAVEVDPILVPRPDTRGGLAEAGVSTSWNWSGFELRRSPFARTMRNTRPAYDWVTGTWHVPSVSSASVGDRRSVLWIGLDGDGTQDLWQAGSQQDVVTIGGGASPYDTPTILLSLTSYNLWTEFVPQQPATQAVTGLSIEPGDEILVQVWIGDAGAPPSLAGKFGVALLFNLTTGVSTRIYTDRGDTRVGGSEAEWIMERPGVVPRIFVPPFSYYVLADYGTAIVYNAYAREANAARGRGYVAYQDAANRRLNMINPSGTVLSYVDALDRYSMKFHFGSPLARRFVDGMNSISIADLLGP